MPFLGSQPNFAAETEQSKNVFLMIIKDEKVCFYSLLIFF